MRTPQPRNGNRTARKALTWEKVTGILGIFSAIGFGALVASIVSATTLWAVTRSGQYHAWFASIKQNMSDIMTTKNMYYRDPPKDKAEKTKADRDMNAIYVRLVLGLDNKLPDHFALLTEVKGFINEGKYDEVSFAKLLTTTQALLHDQWDRWRPLSPFIRTARQARVFFSRLFSPNR